MSVPSVSDSLDLVLCVSHFVYQGKEPSWPSMTPEDLGTALQSLAIGRSHDKDGAFIKLSLKLSTSNVATPNHSPSSHADHLKHTCTFCSIQPTDLIEANFASLSLAKPHEPNPSSLCTASDCPIQDRVHTSGYFFAAPGRGVIWHEDFGFSDPPAYIWAAYFRYTRYRKEIGDHCRSADDFVDLLLQKPFDDAKPDDASIVLNFLRYHTLDLRQGDRHIEVVPLRGRVLSAVEPEVVDSMSSLEL